MLFRSGAGDRAAVLSDGTPDGGHAAEFAGGSGGVSGEKVRRKTEDSPAAGGAGLNRL